MMKANEERSLTLAEAVGKIDDDTVEAVGALLEQKKTNSRRGWSVVLKTLAAAACVCLMAGAVLGTAVFKKLISPAQTDTPIGALSEPETAAPDERTALADAVPVYRSNGDGTCTVIGLENPLNARELNVKIPETSPAGDRVTAYVPENVLWALPTILSDEDFETVLDEMAAAINADSAKRGLKELEWRDYKFIGKRSQLISHSGNQNWFLFTQFMAYYSEQNMNNAETEPDRLTMLANYPMLADTDAVYVLAHDLYLPELTKILCCQRTLAPSLTAQKTLECGEAVNAAAWQEYFARVSAGANWSEALWEDCKEAAAHRFDGFGGIVDAAQIVSLVLPDSIEKLDPGILIGYSMKDFTIPAGVKELHLDFFTFCPCLETVTMSGDEKWTVNKDGAEYSSGEVAALLQAYHSYSLVGCGMEDLLSPEDATRRRNAADDASCGALQAFMEKYGVKRADGNAKMHVFDHERFTLSSGVSVFGLIDLVFKK